MFHLLRADEQRTHVFAAYSLVGALTNALGALAVAVRESFDGEIGER